MPMLRTWHNRRRELIDIRIRTSSRSGCGTVRGSMCGKRPVHVAVGLLVDELDGGRAEAVGVWTKIRNLSANRSVSVPGLRKPLLKSLIPH